MNWQKCIGQCRAAGGNLVHYANLHSFLLVVKSAAVKSYRRTLH